MGPRLQIIIDSTRPGRRGLPLLDERHTQRWSRTISAGDAYVFLVPKHNHSFNAATKNALDHLKDEWRDKPIGLVGYGGGAAGGAHRRAAGRRRTVLVGRSGQPDEGKPAPWC